MIISTSRRTDIPAFYSEWLMNRIDAGYCLVPNPMNAQQVKKISLKREDVDAFVFWSKNPKPMLNCLKKLDDMGYNYIFLYTINDYPKFLEPNMPKITERIETFIRLSKRIGRRRVTWRYDPIIITEQTSVEFHIERFGFLFEKLYNYIDKVIISFFKPYKFAVNRMKKITSVENQPFDYEKILPEIHLLASKIAEIANYYNVKIVSCAEVLDLSDSGILPGACIDGMFLYKIFKREFNLNKDKGQRKECQCVISKDIGTYDTCVHHCVYCYASRSFKLSDDRYKNHNPTSDTLIGWIDETSSINQQKNYQSELSF